MDKITVRQNETFQLPVTIDDETAESVTLTVWNSDGVIISEPAEFVNGEATIDAGIITSAIGLYQYSLDFVFSTGEIDTLPDVTNCDGDCSFPEFEICEGTPQGGS